jgi:hypothetical protein
MGIDRKIKNKKKDAFKRKKQIHKCKTPTNKPYKDNGGTIKVGDTSYTMNLNKLYQLDIKNLVNELLTGTEGLSTTEALDAKIKENINNSTFQGVFPNKIPQNMIKENVSLSTSLNFKKAN